MDNIKKAEWSKRIGRQAEDAVLSAFLARGFHLEARNYRVHPWGELDLIFTKGRRMFVVEVKSRNEANQYGGTAQSITKQKLLRMTRATKVFLLDRIWDMYDVQFVAGFVTHGSDGMIRKIEIHAI